MMSCSRRLETPAWAESSVALLRPELQLPRRHGLVSGRQFLRLRAERLLEHARVPLDPLALGLQIGVLRGEGLAGRFSLGPNPSRLGVVAVFHVSQFELPGFNLLGGRLNVAPLPLNPLLRLAERLLRGGDPRLPFEELAGLHFHGVPGLLNLGFHLLELLRSCGLRLLEFGAPQAQLNLEGLQGLRPFRELAGVTGRFLAHRALPRVKLEGPLFDLANDSVRLAFQIRGLPSRLGGCGLPASQILVVLRDPFDVRPDLLLLVLDGIFSLLDAHHAIRPRGPEV